MTEQTPTAGCPLAHSDAAYVLGSLSPAERLEFERHLPGCASCTRAVGQLAGLPGLLGRVSPESIDGFDPADGASVPVADPPVPDTVLPALQHAVRRHQRRRVLAWSAVAAAAAVVVTVGVLAVRGPDEGKTPQAVPTSTPTAATSNPTPSTAPAQPMTPVADDGEPADDSVSADVALTSVLWGTRLDLTCTYGSRTDDYGGAAGARYALVVRTSDGAEERVASWQALPGRTMHLTGATGTEEQEIASVEIRTDAGEPVLRLTR